MLFDTAGQCLGLAQHLFKSDFPRPGWVEQDAEEIWQLTLGPRAGAMVDQAGGADRIAAIGITNQRETIVFWDRRTGRALAPGDRLAGPPHRAIRATQLQRGGA